MAATRDAVVLPNRVIAQVMNIGGFDDVQKMDKQFGEERLREVLLHAEAGQFNMRSWHIGIRLLSKLLVRDYRKNAN